MGIVKLLNNLNEDNNDIIKKINSVKNNIRILIDKLLIDKLLPKLENINDIEDSKKKEDLEFIINILYEKEDFFDWFICENPELFNWKYYKHKIDHYINDFLNYWPLVKTLKEKSYLKYEVISNELLEPLYHEWLLRIKSEDIQYWEIIDIYTQLWKSIDIAYSVLEILISDIKDWKTKVPASINLELSDFLDPEFMIKFKFLLYKYDLELREWMIILEILENQEINDKNKFQESLEIFRNIWIKIVLDDTMKRWSHLQEIQDIRKITNSHPYIKAIKICWKYLQSLFEKYNEWTLENNILEELKIFIKECIEKGINVIWEWIQDDRIFNFARNILWISHFQWFAFDEIDYDKI